MESVKPVSWSYSSLSLFQQCPHKYYRLRITKDIVEPPAEHLLYGSEAHRIAEEFVRDNTPVPEQFAFMRGALEKLKDMEGIHLCEYKMGLTKGLEPCDFSDANVWWRGIADLIIITGDKAYVVDYKTGKSSKYADTKQLEILSLATFKHFPEVKKIKAALLFVVANDLIKEEYVSVGQGANWLKWIEETSKLESAFKNQVWNPKPNFTCRAHCPIIDCTHNQKKH
jgi:hypothetical protein